MSLQADTMLASALSVLDMSADGRPGFDIDDFGDFYRLKTPDDRHVDLDIEERVSNEGGMVTAIVRELRAAGYGLTPR